jgi:hypothetical protein
VLLALGYSEPPLFCRCPEDASRNLYLWCVCVIIYERPTTDHIRRICHVVEATTPRWTFEGGMREAAQEVLALLRHETEEQMVMPAGDRDHIRCFVNQVKLTRALVRDLDEAIKEVNLLGEHEEESS